MQKKLKDLSSRADEMQARFQASQKQLLNSIGLVGESLESFRQVFFILETSRITNWLSIGDRQVAIANCWGIPRGQGFSQSIGAVFLREYGQQEAPGQGIHAKPAAFESYGEGLFLLLSNLSISFQFVTEMNAFVQRLMPFEEYANKFLKPDSENFDDFASEEMAFNNEIRQRAAHVHNQSRFGLDCFELNFKKLAAIWWRQEVVFRLSRFIIHLGCTTHLIIQLLGVQNKSICRTTRTAPILSDCIGQDRRFPSFHFLLAKSRQPTTLKTSNRRSSRVERKAPLEFSPEELEHKPELSGKLQL